MSITIDSVPEYLTREQYVALFAALGFKPEQVVELRAAHDGVHALVFAPEPDGSRRLLDPADPEQGYRKHRVFIPVRNDDTDHRRTRVRDVAP